MFKKSKLQLHFKTSDSLPAVNKDVDQSGSEIILNSIEDAVVMVDQNNLIKLFNPAAARLSGWPIEEAVGLHIQDVLKLVQENNQPFEPDENPLLISAVTGQTIHDTTILLARNGARIEISLIITPISDQVTNKINGTVTVIRDITKEKAEERQRAEFISTASHEMRTPIAAIEGYLALTLNDKVVRLDNNARSYLEKAHLATKQLGKLFQDLLTSSRAEDGRLQNYPTVVEMGEVVQEITDNARFDAKAKGLGLDLVYSRDPGVAVGGSMVVRPLYYVFVDPSRIREVLQNLVDNAIKYTLTGSVSIRLTGDDGVVQIQIKDSGPGIAPEDLKHLFQKFYRVDNSMTRSVGGTGLGLFICRKILELYNGHIWVESELNKGSTFFVNIPRITKEKAFKLQQEQATHMSVLDKY